MKAGLNIQGARAMIVFAIRDAMEVWLLPSTNDLERDRYRIEFWP